MTQVFAIVAVLCLALVVLFIGWGALAVSSQEEEDQRRWVETMAAAGWQDWPAGEASANGDYAAGSDALDGSDYSDGSEHDNG